ncbi:MAG: phospholipase D-like domain-containing protein [Verrucomicrobiota bacterium]
MWKWLEVNLFGSLINLLGSGLLFLLTNLSVILGLVCAALIIRRVSAEKRSPSNTFAWLLLVLFLPFVGVPLYFIFGGRKSRKMARIKSKVNRHARALSDPEKIEMTPSPYVLAPEMEQSCSKGNYCELLPDGKATFERLCREIEAAEHTIHIATYILGNDRSGKAVTDLLSKRSSEGVTVKLLLDSLGSWNCTRLARHKIRKAGGEVAMFMPVLPLQTQTSSNLRNHRKIAIFDNFRAITGGQNLDNRFLGNWPDPDRFTDFSVVTQGPAVAELTRTFIADWAFAAEEKPAQYRELLQYVPEEAGNSTIEVINSGPDIPNDPLWEQLVRIIQEFKQSLTIITPYFIPDEVILQSLIVKAHTGRQVRVILPLHSNQRLADIARHRTLKQLDAAGVEILFYKPRMMHAKLILADDLVALMGSANIDIRSLFVNFEIALAHYTATDVQMLTQWAQALEKDCITYQEAMCDAAFIPSRLSQDLVHLLVPLL